jgi:predicted ATPase/class 3 adenylate cyclase/DNA-binding CsgD family transcriptional regulator
MFRQHDRRTFGTMTPNALSWGDPAVTPNWAPGSFALPAGTVTFLLTDIEGSTSLWEDQPEDMAAAVARHYELLDVAITAHGGVRPVEQGEGDSVVAAFSRASDALLAARDAQRAFAREQWPTHRPLAVRMAVHTGEARLRDAGNYVGQAVIRTARLRAIAHGGQVLVSAAARDLAVDQMGEEVRLVDLGIHRLKDLARPEQVWQLADAQLGDDFPPLRSLDTFPNNLPVSLSSFIGRYDDIATVARLLDENRLVTLTGSGGAGKTRLAQQVAAEVADRYPDGAWWVDLVGLTDATLLPSAIGRAVVVPEDAADPLGGLTRRLGEKHLLLVFDNCEHLLGGCAEVTVTVLEGCPNASVLTTSRAPLNVPGELSWQIPPLALPEADAAPAVAILSQYDAVRLFADRATKARQNFRLSDDNAPTVAEICSRLDGIPLAIELAAARCRVLKPAQILDGLGNAMGLLAAGPRVVLPRHQTIEASIAWSHSLLSEDERILFRRLAAFAGSFTLDAAEAIIADEVLPTVQVLDLLEHLVDQSLVQMDDTGVEARFRLLETVRQFARRELERSDDADSLAARHATYFAARARGLSPLYHAGMTDLLDRADVEYDDLVAMLAYLERHASDEEYGEVALACLSCMAIRHAVEAAVWADRVIARLVDEPTALNGRFHAQLAVAISEPSRQRLHAELVAEVADATGDPEAVAWRSFWAAWTPLLDDPTPEAVAQIREVMTELAAIGEDHISRAILWTLVLVSLTTGRVSEALGDWERAERSIVCERCGVMFWSTSAMLALALGDLEQARRSVERACRLGVGVRDPLFLTAARLAETEVALYTGDVWPETAVAAELSAAEAVGNIVASGLLLEARAAGRAAAGDLLGVESDFIEAIAQGRGWMRPSNPELRLAGVRHALGDLDGARATVAELSESATRWDGGPLLLSRIDHRTAALDLDPEKVAAAENAAHRSLAAATTGPFPADVIRALELLVSIAVAREAFAEAARLYGATQRLRDDFTFREPLAPERERLARDIACAQDALGSEAFETAHHEGAQLTLEAAVAYARRARGQRKRPSHGWDGLTPMERRVTDLAVLGRSNSEIATQLFVGRETVKTHLSNIYAKLGVANRTQLVADASRRGPTSSEGHHDDHD